MLILAILTRKDSGTVIDNVVCTDNTMAKIISSTFEKVCNMKEDDLKTLTDQMTTVDLLDFWLHIEMANTEHCEEKHKLDSNTKMCEDDLRSFQQFACQLLLKKVSMDIPTISKYMQVIKRLSIGASEILRAFPGVFQSLDGLDLSESGHSTELIKLNNVDKQNLRGMLSKSVIMKTEILQQKGLS